ncbi:hypothetical protein MMF93_14325 [Streptomyces tubbatahanensis]|uniref:Secreted protein n=1 Tax=Streptomyces tubbatahanensis TaxID=2923272 RepID=A0ABY3XSU7_9ACTN|nr:hypothetical protein [Streptomyces tubbatahanensis]UNS97537.1 hypothetical protein MMF93_14325 [Streptomyces tubbatahanensis]
MSRYKKLVATCAVALGVMGALATPALATHASAPADRTQTAGVPDRNGTILPDLDNSQGTVAPTATQAG